MAEIECGITHTHTHVSRDSNPFDVDEHEICQIKCKQHIYKT
jgi:hypothetical protein